MFGLIRLAMRPEVKTMPSPLDVKWQLGWTCSLDAFLLVLLVDQRLVNVWNYASTSNGCLHREHVSQHCRNYKYAGG